MNSWTLLIGSPGVALNSGTGECKDPDNWAELFCIYPSGLLISRLGLFLPELGFPYVARDIDAQQESVLP